MHSEVHAPLGQRLFNFFGEHTLGANLSKRNLSDLVAGGFDDLKGDRVPMLLKERAHVIGLPQRELGTA